jgi:hypothetical protein
MCTDAAAATLEGDDLYNATSCVYSSSGNGMTPSSHEAMAEPPVGGSSLSRGKEGNFCPVLLSFSGGGGEEVQRRRLVQCGVMCLFHLCERDDPH